MATAVGCLCRRGLALCLSTRATSCVPGREVSIHWTVSRDPHVYGRAGVYPSTLHRVRSADGRFERDRRSAVFFATPNWDARVECLVPPEQAREPAVEPFLVGDRMPAI